MAAPRARYAGAGFPTKVEGDSLEIEHLWRDEDETDWVVGMFTGGPSGVQTMRRFESQSSAEEFLAGLQCKPS
jgi:hypothetical protein